MTAGPAADAATLKACCAAGYSSDLVSLLLGRLLPPRRAQADPAAARPLELPPGTGWSTSPPASAPPPAGRDRVRARASTASTSPRPTSPSPPAPPQAAGLADRAEFHHGDAEALPLPDGCVGRACSASARCAPSPTRRPRSRRWPGCCAPEGASASPTSPPTCERLPPRADRARRLGRVHRRRSPGRASTRDLATAAGLRVTTTERHTAALERMVDQIGARLELLRMTSPGRASRSSASTVAAPSPVLDAAQAADR